MIETDGIGQKLTRLQLVHSHGLIKWKDLSHRLDELQQMDTFLQGQGSPDGVNLGQEFVSNMPIGMVNKQWIVKGGVAAGGIVQWED